MPKKVINGNSNYQIDEHGNIFSLITNKQLKWGTSKGGYRNIYLYSHLGYGIGKIRTVSTIHRLVAEHFLENYSEKLEVNHIDNDKNNNHVSNLEMVTPKQNMQHAYNTGRMDNLIKLQKLSKKLGVRIEKANA